MLKASCRCGITQIVVVLPHQSKHYQPRKCDCDFCLTRQLSYISDPQGQATITSAHALLKEKQGSEQADFLCCAQCATVVAVAYQYKNQQICALNANVFAEGTFAEPLSCSPKTLNEDQKIARWLSVWMPLNVILF